MSVKTWIGNNSRDPIHIQKEEEHSEIFVSRVEMDENIERDGWKPKETH